MALNTGGQILQNLSFMENVLESNWDILKCSRQCLDDDIEYIWKIQKLLLFIIEKIAFFLILGLLGEWKSYIRKLRAAASLLSMKIRSSWLIEQVILQKYFLFSL